MKMFRKRKSIHKWKNKIFHLLNFVILESNFPGMSIDCRRGFLEPTQSSFWFFSAFIFQFFRELISWLRSLDCLHLFYVWSIIIHPSKTIMSIKTIHWDGSHSIVSCGLRTDCVHLFWLLLKQYFPQRMNVGWCCCDAVIRYSFTYTCTSKG